MTTGVPTSTAPRRRSPARTFVPLAITAWLILEIWLLTLVAGAAGGLTVAALLAGGMVLGAVVIKRAGRRAFKNLTETFQQAQQGVRPTAQQPGRGNGLTMLAGLFLMMPGLISDAAGLVLLLPPVRAWIGRRAARSLERKMASAPAGSFGDAFQQARIHQPDGKIVQGEVIRDDGPGPDRQGPGASYRPPLAP
ncbi:FxsA family membrane protein [Streptomyces antarcticus]|uniref:FxsA family membrane protein n=1 Tax=Streptomyces antarcticus TaxID=2996458 RepID=UPI00226E66B5|nr:MULTISPECIES: FxsA family membrane protein [unclassified Streptomyces]MCY0945301.1 FxsA family protein [Streptomyces sp. H34-AA3]MCY0952616.1 FxsA family protein [Streptomyces sp. H27-S2]MCZ4087284.1 FxsA family protein [Streptomyces sp. H34-S5]